MAQELTHALLLHKVVGSNPAHFFFFPHSPHTPRAHALTARLPTGNSQTPAPIPKYRGECWCYSSSALLGLQCEWHTPMRAPPPRHQPLPRGYADPSVDAGKWASENLQAQP